MRSPSRITHLFDWRFLLSLALLLLVLVATVSVVNTGNRAQAESRRADAAQTRIDQLLSDQRRANADAAERSRAAGVERDKQLRLLRQANNRLDALVAYLATMGIDLPPDVLSGSRAKSTLSTPIPIPAPAKPSSAPTSRPTDKPTPTKTPEPTATPAAATPTAQPSAPPSATPTATRTPVLCVIGLCLL